MTYLKIGSSIIVSRVWLKTGKLIVSKNLTLVDVIDDVHNLHCYLTLLSLQMWMGCSRSRKRLYHSTYLGLKGCMYNPCNHIHINILKDVPKCCYHPPTTPILQELLMPPSTCTLSFLTALSLSFFFHKTLSFILCRALKPKLFDILMIRKFSDPFWALKGKNVYVEKLPSLLIAYWDDS